MRHERFVPAGDLPRPWVATRVAVCGLPLVEKLDPTLDEGPADLSRAVRSGAALARIRAGGRLCEGRDLLNSFAGTWQCRNLKPATDSNSKRSRCRGSRFEGATRFDWTGDRIDPLLTLRSADASSRRRRPAARVRAPRLALALLTCQRNGAGRRPGPRPVPQFRRRSAGSSMGKATLFAPRQGRSLPPVLVEDTR